MATPRDQHRVWETIAASFDANRTRRWPHIEEFLRGIPPASHVLDLMAGNGRHTSSILETGHRATWLDWSRPAAKIAARRYPKAVVAVGDATLLPFRDRTFDAAIVVAALHSIPTAEGRAACLRELARVLRPGGRAQVTVWSREAPRFRDQGASGEPIDVVLPWRSHGHDEDRQYHLYTAKALRAELSAAGFQVAVPREVSVVGPEPDNLVAVAAKPAQS